MKYLIVMLVPIFLIGCVSPSTHVFIPHEGEQVVGPGEYRTDGTHLVTVSKVAPLLPPMGYDIITSH